MPSNRVVATPRRIDLFADSGTAKLIVGIDQKNRPAADIA
jgi:hypothetical protein